MSDKKYRLVTRSDFDGLVCAVVLQELDLIDDILFVHPKDVQDGKIELGPKDITTNVPYNPNVFLAFDHHFSETIRNAGQLKENSIINPLAPSAARVVYEYYGGKERFPNIAEDMMVAVDKADAARFSLEDILEPKGWDLLSFIMDPRTGLGRFREFRVSNYALMMELIECCRTMSIEEILQLDDVRERVDLYNEHHERAIEQIKECSTIYNNLLVLDLRDADPIWCTNRFTLYAMYPQVNVSIHVLWGMKKQNTVFAVGKSIVNRSCKANIGELMLAHGGGGHQNAGTCQVLNESAGAACQELISQLQEA